MKGLHFFPSSSSSFSSDLCEIQFLLMYFICQSYLAWWITPENMVDIKAIYSLLQYSIWRKHLKRHFLCSYFICGSSYVTWKKRERKVLNLGNTYMRSTIMMWSWEYLKLGYMTRTFSHSYFVGDYMCITFHDHLWIARLTYCWQGGWRTWRRYSMVTLWPMTLPCFQRPNKMNSWILSGGNMTVLCRS